MLGCLLWRGVLKADLVWRPVNARHVSPEIDNERHRHLGIVAIHSSVQIHVGVSEMRQPVVHLQSKFRAVVPDRVIANCPAQSITERRAVGDGIAHEIEHLDAGALADVQAERIVAGEPRAVLVERDKL